MNLEQSLEDLRARVSLMQGSATLLILVAPTESAVDENRRILADILRSNSLHVVDIGRIPYDLGPSGWVETTTKQRGDVYVMGAIPESIFGASAFATLVNTEREFLRKLPGPVLLVISRETEDVLRKRAPDFLTWAATVYELPDTAEFMAMGRRLGAVPTSSQRHIQTEKPFRFLHLSDFHLRPGLIQRFDQDRVLRGLVQFLERDRERFPLDGIFVTGDLGFSGKIDEYELVVDFLRRVLEATGVLPERMYVVPGNHDVDREVGEWLLRTLPTPEMADKFFLRERARDAHARKFAAYAKALAPLLGAQRKLGLGVGKDAVEMVDWGDARLAIASFNSAWFAQDNSDPGKLWLGEANVAEAGDRLAEEKATFSIALLHHPLEHLDEQERDTIEERMERTFDMVLRGHLHKNRTKVVKSQRGGYVEVAGQAAYQTSQWPNGCYLGEIRPCARTVKLFPYRYGKGADPWVLDATVFPDDVATGYAHTFEVPEKRMVPGAIRRAREKAAVEVVQAMPSSAKRQMAQELGWHDSVKKPLSPQIEQRMARKAAVANEDEALWVKPEQAKKLERAVSRAIADEAFADEGVYETYSIANSQSLAKALLDAGARMQKLIERHAQTLGAHERRVLFLDILQRLIRPSVPAVVVHRGGLNLLDMNVGAPSETPKVVIKMAPASFSTFAPALAQLEQDIGEMEGAFGVLVLAGDFGGEVEQARVENVKTPNGREVLLMHLPLPAAS